MFEKMKKYIDKYNMIQKSESVIVGLSGGADSVCLLFLLIRYMHELNGENGHEFLKAVHVHHGIRGAEANRDMEFVQNLCKKEGVELFTKLYDVPAYSVKHRISTEEGGRILRYQFMQDIAKKLERSTVKIAVAHNCNDNAETVLHNLCRGTGLKGMGGIMPVNGNIIRPILCLSRDEIESYLSEKKINYLIDSTNQKVEYTRNRIRLNVIPLLQKEINRKSLEHINNASENVKEAEDFLKKITNQVYEKVVYTDNNYICMRKDALVSIEPYICKRVIREAVFRIAGKMKDITQIHIDDIVLLMDSEPGKYIQLPYSIIIKNDYTRLILMKKECNDIQKDYSNVETIINQPGKYKLKGYDYSFEISDIFFESLSETVKFLENNIKNQENLYTKWIDYDKIKTIVCLRYRMSGDYLTVDSKHSHKKLKSYFIDNKISQIERFKIPLLADGSHIIWVIGHRISDEYKVTESTRHILKIERKDITKDAK